jgi:hypothetical protein
LKVKGLTFKPCRDLNLVGVADGPPHVEWEMAMKMKLIGLAAALVAMFGTVAAAATKIGSTGCCPLCR